MPKYEYLCDGCGREYVEHRSISDPQLYIDCGRCPGKLIEK